MLETTFEITLATPASPLARLEVYASLKDGQRTDTNDAFDLFVAAGLPGGVPLSPGLEEAFNEWLDATGEQWVVQVLAAEERWRDRADQRGGQAANTLRTAAEREGVDSRDLDQTRTPDSRDFLAALHAIWQPGRRDKERDLKLLGAQIKRGGLITAQELADAMGFERHGGGNSAMSTFGNAVARALHEEYAHLRGYGVTNFNYNHRDESGYHWQIRPSFRDALRRHPDAQALFAPDERRGVDDFDRTPRAFLYHWKDRKRDLADGGVWLGGTVCFRQKSPTFRTVRPGDRVWLSAMDGPGRYVLAGVPRVSDSGWLEAPAPGRRGGDWFVEATAPDAVFFEPEGQADLEPLLRRALGLSRADVAVLGHAFQGAGGVRALPDKADKALSKRADALRVAEPTADTARQRWAKRGDTGPSVGEVLRRMADAQAARDAALEDDARGMADQLMPLLADASEPPATREYLAEVRVRDSAQARELKALYGDRCQLTGKRPLGGAAGDITEAHHIEWLSRDGLDVPENMVVLSPDWHRAIHAANAEFDWRDLAFVIEGKRHKLRLNKHLKRRR